GKLQVDATQLGNLGGDDREGLDEYRRPRRRLSKLAAGDGWLAERHATGDVDARHAGGRPHVIRHQPTCDGERDATAPCRTGHVAPRGAKDSIGRIFPGLSVRSTPFRNVQDLISLRMLGTMRGAAKALRWTPRHRLRTVEFRP